MTSESDSPEPIEFLQRAGAFSGQTQAGFKILLHCKVRNIRSTLSRLQGFPGLESMRRMPRLSQTPGPIAPPLVRTLKIEADGDFWKGLIKPKIRIKGHWLEQAGFRSGNRVQIACNGPGIIELRAPDPLSANETKPPSSAPGRPERSPAQAPLRTVRESFPSYGSSLSKDISGLVCPGQPQVERPWPYFPTADDHGDPRAGSETHQSTGVDRHLLFSVNTVPLNF